jgi:CYTH domain-containing protein
MEDWHRYPGRGAYARPERERRFLVAALPPSATRPLMIEDWYVLGTTLRLRRMGARGEHAFKLTQKIRASDGDPAEVAITTAYLTEDEFELLTDLLPATVVRKTRWRCEGFIVDELHGALEGLLLAEVQVDDLSAPIDLPSWLGDEVTHDDRYSGGSLATNGVPS